MLIEMLKPNFIHSDDRGTLTQLVREGFRQINVIESRSGGVRGGHYHARNSEAFYVVKGVFKLVVSLGEENEGYEFRTGEMFLIPPLVVHGFEFMEDSLLISMYDRGVELPDGSKDILTAR
jgi:dTDP-4-dehydrorhamnose 3,5-epimerase-like enzyme